MKWRKRAASPRRSPCLRVPHATACPLDSKRPSQSTDETSCTAPAQTMYKCVPTSSAKKTNSPSSTRQGSMSGKSAARKSRSFRCNNGVDPITSLNCSAAWGLWEGSSVAREREKCSYVLYTKQTSRAFLLEGKKRKN